MTAEHIVFEGLACLNFEHIEGCATGHLGRYTPDAEFGREGTHRGSDWGDLVGSGTLSQSGDDHANMHHPWRWRGGPDATSNGLIGRVVGRHP